MKRKIICLFLAIVSSVSMTGCSGNFVKGRTLYNLHSGNGDIIALKRGTPNACSEKCYSEVFKKYFKSPRWKCVSRTEDKNQVKNYIYGNVVRAEFTGYCSYKESDIRVVMKLALNKNKNTIKVTYLSINNVPQSYFYMEDFLEFIFMSAKDKAGQQH